MHIRDDKVIGIVVAIHNANDMGWRVYSWIDVLWTDEDRPFKERMRNLRVIS
tara:strand:+ start:407 stop:562 length:156 start_codon:yes stop_codon:yes gene_type:complete